MGFFDKVAGWFGRAIDRVAQLREKMQPVVDHAVQLSEQAAEALLEGGNDLAALEPSDLAWLTGPVAQAVAAAQASALVTGAVGRHRLEAVRVTLYAANLALHKADEAFDRRWAMARPYIERLVRRLKDREILGFRRDAEEGG